MAAILDDATLEPAFVALALTPPGEGDISREIGRDIDPDAIYRARANLRAAIGQRLGPALAEIYERMATTGPYSPDAASAGRRALRNIALDLLAANGAPQAIARAARQYDTADNMTDRMAALSTLSQHAVPERETVLADFYKRYAADALIVDKWFSLQAMTPQPDTLDHVRTLTGHPAFAMSNLEPRARFDRRLCAKQPDPVQPRRRRRLRICRRYHSRARSEESAARGADGNGVPYLAHPGSRPAGQGTAALQRIKGTSGLSRDLSDIIERALG